MNSFKMNNKIRGIIRINGITHFNSYFSSDDVINFLLTSEMALTKLDIDLDLTTLSSFLYWPSTDLLINTIMTRNLQHIVHLSIKLRGDPESYITSGTQTILLFSKLIYLELDCEGLRFSNIKVNITNKTIKSATVNFDVAKIIRHLSQIHELCYLCGKVLPQNVSNIFENLNYMKQNLQSLSIFGDFPSHFYDIIEKINTLKNLKLLSFWDRGCNASSKVFSIFTRLPNLDVLIINTVLNLTDGIKFNVLKRNNIKYLKIQLGSNLNSVSVFKFVEKLLYNFPKLLFLDIEVDSEKLIDYKLLIDKMSTFDDKKQRRYIKLVNIYNRNNESCTVVYYFIKDKLWKNERKREFFVHMEKYKLQFLERVKPFLSKHAFMF